MKRKILYGMLSSALLLGTAACSDDYNPASSSSGKINPIVDLDTDVAVARSTQGRDAAAISVNDLQLKLTSADGSRVNTWASVAEFDNNQEYPVGSYTMEAWYGDAAAEGFDVPYYYGTTTLSVRENKVTTVSLTASLANSMVTIATTDAFRDYFTNYSFQAHAEGGQYITFKATETRPAYLKPGKVTITADVTKPNGVSGTLEAASFVAEAKHHYTVTIDVNNGNAGQVQLVISFDDSLNREEVVIDLSDELLSAPAPEVKVDGFDPATNYSFIENNIGDFAPSLFINAANGLKSVVMTTHSASLMSQGWFDEIDLIGTTEAQQAKLKALGLDVVGLFGVVDKMAQIKLTEVVRNIGWIEGSDNITTISFVVTDKLGKVSEPVTLNITVSPVVISIAESEMLLLGSTTGSVTLAYNGSDVAKDVKFQYKNTRGTWTDLTITNVTGSDGNYTVTLDGIPADDETVTLRATAANKTSNELTLTKGGFVIAAPANDTFATYARIVPTFADEDTEAAASTVKYQVSTDGSNFSDATFTIAADGSATLSGLTDNTNYTVRATIGDATATTTLTTEQALQLPNSDMETWHNSYAGSNYDIWWPGSGSTGIAWGTSNPMTTSEGSDLAYCRISGTLPGESGHNGSQYCAYLRSIGWGSGNTASGYMWSAIMHYADAGLLHLGSSRSSRPSDYTGVAGPVTTTDLTCGLSFASRPKAISFWYKYSPKNSNDRGYVEYWIKDASGNVLQSGSQALQSASDWSQVTLNCTYAVNTAKAATIYVKFLSSYSGDYLTKSSDNFSVPSFGNLSDGKYLGSQMWIDDIQLTY